MSRSKKQIYVVIEGYKPGIYKKWDECSEQVTGYKNAVFKGFVNELDAIAWQKKKLKPATDYPAILYIGIDDEWSDEPESENDLVYIMAEHIDQILGLTKVQKKKLKSTMIL